MVGRMGSSHSGWPKCSLGTELPSNEVPPVVVLDKSPNSRHQIASRQSHDFWAYQLTHTLDTKFKINKAHLARELTVEPFVENGEFETDIRNQVAIWHGGFLKAMVSVEKIIAWLSRL